MGLTSAALAASPALVGSLIRIVGLTVAWPCCSVPALGFLLRKHDSRPPCPLDFRFFRTTGAGAVGAGGGVFSLCTAISDVGETVESAGEEMTVSDSVICCERFGEVRSS